MINKLSAERPMMEREDLCEKFATRSWYFGVEMSRTTRSKRSSHNLCCVSHSYFLEIVNFSPVILNTE